MNVEKLNPWNWFKHEQGSDSIEHQVPVKRNDFLPLTSGSPFESFSQLQREMDRLFDETFRTLGMPYRLFRTDDTRGSIDDLGEGFRPSTDVSGSENQYNITLDIPGLTEDDITIELKNRILTIKGEKETKSESDDKKFYRVERSFGSFQRTLALPDDASGDDIIASMKNGVLKLTVPRMVLPESDVKRISISS